MTQAFQTGQFHPNEFDRPATAPSVFDAMDHPAQSAVDDDKRTMIRRLARLYLRGFPESERRTIPVRFDVVSVYPGDKAEFEVFKGAFAW